MEQVGVPPVIPALDTSRPLGAHLRGEVGGLVASTAGDGTLTVDGGRLCRVGGTSASASMRKRRNRAWAAFRPADPEPGLLSSRARCGFNTTCVGPGQLRVSCSRVASIYS